jgi:hypothetical protein
MAAGNGAATVDRCATLTTTGSFYYRPSLGGPVVSTGAMRKTSPMVIMNYLEIIHSLFFS